MNVIDLGLAVLALSFAAGLLRAVLGPTLADRAVAADLCLFTVVGSLALLSVKLEAPEFLDAVLVATLLGFIATISLARLIRKKP